MTATGGSRMKLLIKQFITFSLTVNYSLNIGIYGRNATPETLKEDCTNLQIK